MSLLASLDPAFCIPTPDIHWARRPPSKMSDCPVMNFESSVSRNTTEAAISSGWMSLL